MYGDDKPQRGIDRVELRLSALVWKAIGQHPLGDGCGPGEQNVSRHVQPTGGEAQAAQRDERVTTPIREPRVTGDDGLPFPALDDVGVRRSLESGREPFAPLSLAIAPLVQQFERLDTGGEMRGGVLPSRQYHRGCARREVPFEDSGCGQVLLAVEAAVALFAVKKVVMPLRLVCVIPVGKSCDGGHAGIRLPTDSIR